MLVNLFIKGTQKKKNRASQPCISRYFSKARTLAMSNLILT